MTRQEKAAVVLGLVLLALFGLFPPWTESVTAPTGYHQELPRGYGFLFSPPHPNDDAYSITLDRKRLAASWAVVVLLTGVVVVLLHSSQATQSRQEVGAREIHGRVPNAPMTYRQRIEVTLLLVLVAALFWIGKRTIERTRQDQWVIERERRQADQAGAGDLLESFRRQDSLERKAALGRQRRLESQRAHPPR